MNPFRSRRPLQSLDELNRTLLLAGIIAMLMKMFFQHGTWPRMLLTAISFAALVCLVLRLFSKDPVRVQTQNHKFIAAVTAVKEFFRTGFQKKSAAGNGAKTARSKRPTFQELRQYKYFVCPQCAQRLRVPRGKGRLRVTCTRCGNRFEIKS